MKIAEFAQEWRWWLKDHLVEARKKLGVVIYNSLHPDIDTLKPFLEAEKGLEDAVKYSMPKLSWTDRQILVEWLNNTGATAKTVRSPRRLHFIQMRATAKIISIIAYMVSNASQD